jgi:hypothetical protein
MDDAPRKTSLGREAPMVIAVDASAPSRSDRTVVAGAPVKRSIGGSIRRAARVANPVTAAVVVTLVFVQVYLIASFIFGDAGALDAHMAVGRVTVGCELGVLVTALIGWWGDWAETRGAAALVVVGGLQASLAKDIGSSPQVHALHGFLALVVAALAWSIAVRRRGELASQR